MKLYNQGFPFLYNTFYQGAPKFFQAGGGRAPFGLIKLMWNESVNALPKVVQGMLTNVGWDHPRTVWSRDSTKINCPKGSGKVSNSLRSRRYSRARENGKLEIPPAQKRHILSSPRQLSAGAFWLVACVAGGIWLVRMLILNFWLTGVQN